MKPLLTLFCSLSFFCTSFLSAADPAFEYLIMNASSENGKSATLMIGISAEKPGEIAFGQMIDKTFVGQRIYFRAMDYHSKKIEVIAEDVAKPELDQVTKLIGQKVHKKIFQFMVDGKTRTIEINGKKLTFTASTYTSSYGEKRIFIEQ